jgi:hypothetical protein
VPLVGPPLDPPGHLLDEVLTVGLATKPDDVLEKMAMPVTQTPRSRPATKKSRDERVRRNAHKPTPRQATA